MFEQMVAGFLEHVPITPDDLADYAGRLFDYYRAHPKLLQLATWYRLERELPSGIAETTTRVAADKVAAIEAAQDAGRVATTFAAIDLLVIVVALSQVGSPISVESLAGETRIAATRAAVVKAVAELTAPG